MPSSAEYQKLAQECIALAERTTDPKERGELLRMAAGWERLAEYKARIEQEEQP